jgi:hypothetical protein
MVDDEQRGARQDALDRHDDIVQGIALAKLRLELGDTEAGMAALERTLEAARELVIDLVDDRDATTGSHAGELRRVSPAKLA